MSSLISPKKVSLDIIFEDESLIILNKPSGVVVNVSKTSPSGTIQNELQKMFEENSWVGQSDGDGGDDNSTASEFAKRTGIVHRLDKDTSGVLLIAKDEEAFHNLKNQFKNREVQKEYLALVLGELSDPVIEVNAPIGRNPERRTRMAVVDGGRKAETRFELDCVTEYEDEKLSLVKCCPKTGRTHQIRVHLSAMKHPIISDPIYMTRKQFEKFESFSDRLMLHAWKLRFNHPKNQKELFFEAPLPKMFTEICSKPH